MLRETDTVYQWQKVDASGNRPYLEAGLLDLPASTVTISPNASANIKSGCPVSVTTTATCMAETDYVYDEPAYLIATSASTQHGAPPASVRGNQTTVSHWLSTGNIWVSSHTNWYDTGEPYQKIDPLGHTTSFTYDPVYAYAYLTQTCSPTTNGVAHCVSATYDFNSGLLTSFTNENATTQASGNTPGDSAHTSSYQYDLLFRPSKGIAPPDPDPNNGGAQAQTTLTYSDTTAPNSFPWTLTLQKPVTTALMDSATSSYDGLGRVFKTQHAMPSGNPATVDTTFDAAGRVGSVSNPYFSTADTTYGITSTVYDAVDRPTQVTEQDGSVKSVSYDVVSLSGSLGNCTLTTDEAGKQRRTCSDGLGRLVEVDEPNPGAVATAAQATITISGSEQANPLPASSGSGYVDIGGTQNSTQTCTDPLPPRQPVCTTVQDSGNVSIQVGSYPAKSASYPSNSTTAALASALASAFHNDTSGPADGAVDPNNSSRVLLTARSTGIASNLALSASPTQATAPDFYGTASGTAFTGGRDSSSSPDAGTVTVTINGTPYQTSYGGGDSATTIAQRLAAVISSGTLANASASGGTITITAKNTGPGGDYSFSTSYTYDSAHFGHPSFTPSPATGALAGGFNAGAIDNQPYVTLYSYDALGNLLCVEQHGNVTGTGCSASPTSDATSPWRVRRFTYDSLSRLLTAHNPESGTISYSYDADGNLLQKTSPAPNQTGTATQTISYCYDELHRVTGKAYSAQTCSLTAPVVTYTYDSGANAKGKLTGVTDQAGTASYSYDVLGRLSSETRTIAGVSKSISYEYNLDGSLKTLHYPSGRTVTYTPDSAGRIVSAADGNGTQYVSSATYYSNGAEYQRNMPGIYFRNDLNPRLQVSGFYSDNGQTSSFFINKSYNYGALHQNNGNVMSIINNKDSNRTETFTYDALNRITGGWSAANTGALSWGESYGIDAWGNLMISPMAGKAHGGNFQHAGSVNNQASGLGYDAAGNLTNYTAPGQYVYDPENRIQSTAGVTYTYDADGNRVEKSGGSVSTLYWYGAPGIIAESDLSGTLKSEYVFFNGKRLARIDLPARTVHYYLSDHLNSTSMVVSASGVVEDESDYSPFGTEYPITSSGLNHYKFTSKERDTESGLDYFVARYYSNGMGRFITPDWAASAVDVPYAEFADPQSLNLYTYVRNIPTTKVDADGHCPWCIGAAIGAVVGGGANIIAQKIANPHGSINWTHVGAAALGGAIAGATMGLAAPATMASITTGELVTVSSAGIGETVATGAAAGTAGGIVERASDTGSMNKATEDPVAIIADATSGAIAEGAGQAIGNVVRSSNPTLKQAEAKAGRLTAKSAASRVKKATAALRKAEAKADGNAKAAEAAVSTAAESAKNTLDQRREQHK